MVEKSELNAKRIYFLSKAHDEVCNDFNEKMLNGLQEKSIFVIDFARDGEDKFQERRERDRSRLLNIGFEKIIFTSDLNEKDFENKMNAFEVVFILGGTNIKFLLNKLKELCLDVALINFRGIIIGNSAGVYVLCKNYLKFKKESIDFLPMLGFFDFNCKVHYNKEFDERLLEISKEEKIYTIENESMIVLENGEMEIFGNVYLFENGEKIKVS